MDNVQNSDSYINIPSSQYYRSYSEKINFVLEYSCEYSGYISKFLPENELIHSYKLQIIRNWFSFCDWNIPSKIIIFL
jgi:hypothetical protein